jgi:hypothetical protein
VRQRWNLNKNHGYSKNEQTNMKIKSLSCLLFIIIFSSNAFSQSVVITPKKVTYKRPKPVSEYKKSFIVTYPKVKAATPVLSKKIEMTISYEKVSNLNVKEEISEIQWLEEASYTTNYNKKGILDITLTVEGTGAYPSAYSKTVVVDVQTGNRVKPIDVFTNLAGLAEKCKKAQQAEIKQAIIDIKKDSPEEENPAELFKESNFTVKNLTEFTINDKGITFIYDYGFPHVIQALQPAGTYFFSWAQLKPFVKSGSLFSKFTR